MRMFLIVVGSALGGIVLFVVGVIGYFTYRIQSGGPLPSVSFSSGAPARSETLVREAPPVAEQARFFGSTGVSSGEFPSAAEGKVLASGPGRLVGSVTADARPVAGLRVRLLLNGAVMSEWASSGPDGRYEIAVPYGKYRIDGYKLDSDSAHRTLSGKIDAPYLVSSSEVMLVGEGRPGRGLDLRFVEPVKKKIALEMRASNPAVVAWEGYPGAAKYRLQVIEQADPRDFQGEQRLFDWRRRPVVAETSTDLTSHGVTLRKGLYYTVEVEAVDDNGRAIATTPRSFRNADFRVVE